MGEPVLIAPGRAGEAAHIGAGPVVFVPSGGRRILYAGAPSLGRELVAQAGIDAPAVDVLADLVVDTRVAEPSGIDDGGGGAERELAVGAHAARRRREHETVDTGVSCVGFHRPGSHVAGELIEHAGSKVGLPGDARAREVGADGDAGATEQTVDVVDRHGAPRKRAAAIHQPGYVERIDFHTRPHEAARRLDEPAGAERNVVADVGGHRLTVGIERLAEQTVGRVREAVLIEIEAQLTVEEEVPLGEGGVDPHEGDLGIGAEGPRRREEDVIEGRLEEGPSRRDVFRSGLEVAGRHAPVPVGAGAATVEDRDVVADLKASIVLAGGRVAGLPARGGRREAPPPLTC